jgi:RNA polymerase sigma-70 factor (ECF subfamily)
MKGDRKVIPLYVVPPGASPEVGDSELARALIANVAWSHALAWNRFAPMVYGMLLRQFGSAQDAEDLTQEIFARVFAKVGGLQKAESLRSYITSFVIRTMKWEMRKRRSGRWLTFFASDTLPEVPIPGMDPVARDVLRRFYALLERLAPRERMVFSLRHVEAMKLEEIAEVLDISISTVKRTHERAAARIARWIEGDSGLASFFAERPRHDS